MKVKNLYLFVLITAVALAGCSKAGPARNTSFVKGDLMAHDPSLPFHQAWKKPGFDKTQYTKLYVAPVNTAYMLSKTEWSGSAKASDYAQDIEHLATYTREAVKKAFREDKKARFTLINTPSTTPDTLVLEMAITEVVPSKVVLNALGFAPFGIGLAVKAVRTMAGDCSTAAFEARIKDGATGEVVAMLADREAEQNSVVTVRGLSWFSHVHAMVDTWSEQLVDVANRKSSDVVKDSAVFTLKPW